MASYNNSQSTIDFNTPVTLSGAANVTASLEDYIIAVDNTAAARTVTIPTASNTGANANRGKVYIIKDQSGLAGTNNITIHPTSGTIDGAESISINSNFGEVEVYSDGSNWFIKGVVSVGRSGFNNMNVKEFKSTGAYTPTAGMSFCIIELIGGGGGGGGVIAGASNQVSAGAGGGSGGYVKSLLTAAQIGASQIVIIGTGGTPGAAGGNLGGTGVDTYFGALLNASGGNGGYGDTGGGFEAAATTGGRGGSPTVSTGLDMGSSIGSPGGNGIGSISGVSGTVSSGCGGAFRFGGGPGGIAKRVNTASGEDSSGISGAANTGSGGTGAVSIGTGSLAKGGGAGASGIVLITEFIDIP